MFTFTVPQYTLTYKFQEPNNAQIRKLIYSHLEKLRMHIRSFSNTLPQYLNITLTAIRILYPNSSFKEHEYGTYFYS
jgi:hypothetical protein